MRTGVSVERSPEDRVRLNKLVANRNAPKKHAWRAEIVLLTADGVGYREPPRQIRKRIGLLNDDAMWTALSFSVKCWSPHFSNRPFMQNLMNH